MKAVQVHEFGPVDSMTVEDVPMPVPGPGEVLVKVEIAGLIFGDICTRLGTDPALPDHMPYTPGLEVAGTVEALGPGVEGVAVGMRMMAFIPHGGNAEYAIAPAHQVVPIPDHVRFDQAICYLLNAPVAYFVYYVFGAVKPDDTVLIHAGAGGLGTLITQIGKRRHNNRIIALASTDEKVDYCLSQGADFAINYRTHDYVEEVLRITDGKGVDVSLNSVSGPTLDTDPYAIRPLGRWAIYGWAAGQRSFDPFKHFTKALTINVSAGYAYVNQPEFKEALAFRANWLQNEELISPTRFFSLDEAQNAHRWLEGQQSIGKCAFKVR